MNKPARVAEQAGELTVMLTRTAPCARARTFYARDQRSESDASLRELAIEVVQEGF